jgi:hypothetical protein
MVASSTILASRYEVPFPCYFFSSKTALASRAAVMAVGHPE